LVLGTDMANHGSLVKSLSGELDASVVSSGSLSKKGAALLLQIAMKCADLGHLALNWPLHLKWVARLEAEFFAQGDKEKHLGLPVSFLMDREKPGVTKSQVGFFDFAVLPLFQALARAIPSCSDMLNNVTGNYQQWKSLETSGVDGGNAADKCTESAVTVAPPSEKVSVVSPTDDDKYSSATATFRFGPETYSSRQKQRVCARQRAGKSHRYSPAHPQSLPMMALAHRMSRCHEASLRVDI